MNIEFKHCKTVIFFGGPSNERNISLDSARTFYDSIRHHLPHEHLTLIFISKNIRFYRLHPNWIYSNTIEDFEDLLEASDIKKISKSYKKNIKHENFVVGKRLSTSDLNKIIDDSHAFFPLIHGAYGEDGTLTRLIQKRGRKAIIGAPPEVLYTSFKKHLTHLKLKNLGLGSYPYLFITQVEWIKDSATVIKTILDFATSNKKICQNGLVIKPNDCGSSDGVSLIESFFFKESRKYNDAKTIIESAVQYALGFSNEVLVEERLIGKEFSLIVFEDFNHQPKSLYPTEIVLVKKNNPNTNEGKGFYSRQKKYMPGSGVEHITPARLPHSTIQQIRSEAQELFKKLGFKDWARFDGFYIPNSKNKHKGKVVWSDLNSQPGIGQDSLLFQQSIYLGIDTYSVSIYLLRKALAKEKAKLVGEPQMASRKQIIGVVGGGVTSERQVSRMSWCNVIEKLDRLKTYSLRYLFLDKNSHLWEVPRPYTLKHTTEEIEQLIKRPLSVKQFPGYEVIFKKIKTIFPEAEKQSFRVKKLSWSSLTGLIDYLFIALHGGIGENGSLQKRLTSLNIPYNGSEASISKLCFDKSSNQSLIEMVREINTLKRDFGSSKIHLPYQISIDVTAVKAALAKKKIDYQSINALATFLLQKTNSLNKLENTNNTSHIIIRNQDYKKFSQVVIEEINRQIKKKYQGYDKKKLSSTSLNLNEITKRTLVVKPSADGCSTGVVVCNDFKKIVPRYFLLLLSKYRSVPAYLFNAKSIEGEKSEIKSKAKETSHSKNNANSTGAGGGGRHLQFSGSGQSKILFEEFLDIEKGYIELTVGVIGERGKMIALLPSKTIAETQVLSVDEKFNKGVGPNLTPPRELNIEQIATIRAEVADFANKIGLKDYARIDLFYHPVKDKLYLIEVNTLPGLTAATILFTQVLVTPQAQYPPSEFLDRIISFSQKTIGKKRSNS